MRWVLPLLLASSPVLAQEARDPGSVPLPATVEAQLKLGAQAPYDRFGAAFDRLAPDGALPVIGAGATLQIRAAADRARVFLAYSQYDLDGDGVVSRREYDAHAANSWGDTLGEREFAILDEEWARADRDGDGQITLTEIHALALTMHPVPDAAPLGEEGIAMLAMDLDNDGFVYWDEVEAVLASRGR
ncbi:MAG: hypothetical protein P8X76_07730 [Maritimibacter sp.]